MLCIHVHRCAIEYGNGGSTCLPVAADKKSAKIFIVGERVSLEVISMINIDLSELKSIKFFCSMQF